VFSEECPVRLPIRGMAFGYTVQPSQVKFGTMQTCVGSEYQKYCNYADDEASFSGGPSNTVVLKDRRKRDLGLPPG